ncbi:MAG: hypothetical protein L0I95_09870 [Tetragenococcus koreensis]|uniref:hypothetical protein n=1 Tax=Tetragenococcus halophilus TaxID=51669 RepID=UPI00077C78BB|nr:hypothetical protein [Tetragenococcus halophilus]MDN6140051.1 hypothetical protein [Tetragenococcus koreensis]MDN6385936.1 hypothetical protein [Alkalibacterium sp.]MDN6270643.1 hypothetical protein [Tetragenococcus koreensis]MDN6497551.1 hypothetical protein [Tetragenococcus koreensis]MDN6502278.1 hypothetical protein [Tetragenococcus koreensis]
MKKKIACFWSIFVLLSLFLLVWPSGVETDSKPPKKEIQIDEENSESSLYGNSQTEITFEFVHGKLLLRDTDTQRQRTFEKGQKIDSQDKSKTMITYQDSSDSDSTLFYDKKSQEIIYNNTIFKKIADSDQAVNVQSAIEKVKDEKTNNQSLIYSGSNIRQSDDKGRLYYKVNVRNKTRTLQKVYKVYADDGEIVSYKNKD